MALSLRRRPGATKSIHLVSLNQIVNWGLKVITTTHEYTAFTKLLFTVISRYVTLQEFFQLSRFGRFQWLHVWCFVFVFIRDGAEVRVQILFKTLIHVTRTINNKTWIMEV